MECNEIQLELQAYLKGELPLALRAEIQRHLSECPTCAEEAASMKEIGHRLHTGLHGWADQGICPPELMARLEESIHSLGVERQVRKRPWYQSWPAVTGAVAAAAVLLVLLGGEMGMRDQMAAIPFIGTVTTHLFPNAQNLSGYRLVRVKASDSRGGITLTVTELEAGQEQTRIHYSLSGKELATDADSSAYRSRLEGPVDAVGFKSISVKQQDGRVEIDALFDAVPPGTPLTLTIYNVPRRPAAGGSMSTQSGPWTVSFKG